MDIDPMELGMVAQILSIQGLFIVHLLAMVQPALAPTTPKKKDIVPIMNQELEEVGFSRWTRAAQVDMRNVTIEAQNGGQS